MPAIVRDVVDTELLNWEEVAYVAAQRERMTDCLYWEGPTIPRPVLEGLRKESNSNGDCGDVRKGARRGALLFCFVLVVLELCPPNCCCGAWLFSLDWTVRGCVTCFSLFAFTLR
ncbi:putative elongation factor 1-gamma (EF-1-gamma) [Trypanosoma cruzi]|nr:putative elongation factor 1-gamma (EF-1-gamma) [Trypanosoma cruzi]